MSPCSTSDSRSCRRRRSGDSPLSSSSKTWSTPIPLIPKGLDKDGALSALQAVIRELQPIEHFVVAVLEGALRSLAERLSLKAGPLFGAVRLAVTGSTTAPPLFDTLAVLGKDRVMKRLNKAVSVLQNG